MPSKFDLSNITSIKVTDTKQSAFVIFAWVQEVAISMQIPSDHQWVDDVTVKLMCHLHGLTAYKNAIQLAARREYNRLLWEG